MRASLANLLHATLPYQHAYRYHSQTYNHQHLCNRQLTPATACMRLNHLPKMELIRLKNEGLSHCRCKGKCNANVEQERHLL